MKIKTSKEKKQIAVFIDAANFEISLNKTELKKLPLSREDHDNLSTAKKNIAEKRRKVK